MGPEFFTGISFPNDITMEYMYKKEGGENEKKKKKKYTKRQEKEKKKKHFGHVAPASQTKQNTSLQTQLIHPRYRIS